jgi:hypothetical protein
VAGVGRSGSTLLGALLGQLDGFFYAGELAKIGRALANHEPCGCGESLATCPTWRAILRSAFPELEGLPEPSRLEIDVAEVRATGVLRQRLRSRSLFPASVQLDRARTAFDAMLRAIPTVTGHSVVVDSSKLPGYGTFLQQTRGLELSVVHLVRDPRAVLHSRLRTGARRGEALRPGPRTFGLVWDIHNATIELGRRPGKYLRLRYEDLVAHPQAAVDRIANLVAERPRALPFVSTDTVDLVPTHSVAGNRARFQTGAVPIRLDDEWRSVALGGALDRRVASALTWPLRAHYGYTGRAAIRSRHA